MDVVVIGSGVIGLTTALRLQERGLRVVVVTADGLLSTVSAVAAAVWYPVGVETGERVADWSATTFAELARQAADGVPGVVMRDTWMPAHRRQGEAAPWWGGGVPDLRRLEPSELAPGYADGWRFTAPTVEMPLYLPWLLGRFLDGGGEVVHRRLDTLPQARAWAPVAVNASGLGARQLCGDDELRPVRGQLVLVRNPGLRSSLRIQDDPSGYTYVHPRSRDVVLGGTFEEGSWDLGPDRLTAEAILARCAVHVPELRGAEIIGQPLGLRPDRRGGVRLEVEDGAGGLRIVHNYGHGGAGVTLSWGCADAVAELVGG
ncbi:FAD-dependent oxidoreductase [Kitasatospora cathayae]|uniref:D-amino-acid oxidase n=1 Tax=Kitasatospora cathayae TaxID=3004092 RepID=A0ABY7QBV1_9ACTN|nr:FAD-dependent oxidoreductase [Kitasatospora sp. HUAS 3-15]WBP90239.1 FAD-dependent oxidoreductase [Kitasatospora sp. HUAS 3-15]